MHHDKASTRVRRCIPLQEKPVSDPAILTAKQANIKYSTPEQVLADFNKICNTTLAIDYHPLRSLLASFISQGLDFGAIYARLRTSWPASYETPRLTDQVEDDFLEQVFGLEAYGESNNRERERSIDRQGQTIHRPYRIHPRRLWDLHANRVIPYHYALRQGGFLAPQYWAISHSWTDDMVGVGTPVNGNEWPVLLPADIALEAVRTELLNLGAEHVWLDVLCLRQSSPVPGKNELRDKEWAVDVPTLGSVYVDGGAFRVVRYMNGLGRVFETSGWDGPRHWLNRAWTLQEMKFDSITGGVPQGMKDPLDEVCTDPLADNLNPERLRDRISLILEIETQDHGIGSPSDFPNIINAMRRRFSTNPVDKIAGIAMLFHSTTLPLYDGARNEQDAWTLCVSHLSPKLRRQLLFGFHSPGDGNATWRPSWSQLMTNDALKSSMLLNEFISTEVTINSDGSASYRGPVLVARFTPIPHDDRSVVRRGKVTVHGANKMEEFNVRLALKAPVIAESDYIFVGDEDLRTWIICGINGTSLRDWRCLRKLTVAVCVSEEEADRLEGLKLHKGKHCHFV